MRAVIQRVNRASVSIGGSVHEAIGPGLLVLLGMENADQKEDIQWLSNKVVNLRIFNDENGAMNMSVLETGGEILLISQFTLFAATKRGKRPSFIRASKPVIAIPLYESMIGQLEKVLGKKIKTGVFGADMQIDLQIDGPVTISIDTKQKE